MSHLKIVLLDSDSYLHQLSTSKNVHVSAFFLITPREFSKKNPVTLLSEIESQVPAETRKILFYEREWALPSNYVVTKGPEYQGQENIVGSDLETLSFWIDQKGLVNYSSSGVWASKYLVSNLITEEERFGSSKQSLYVFPVQGLGGGVIVDPEVFQELVKFFIGLFVGNASNRFFGFLTKSFANRKARKLASELRSRGLRGLSEIREWADSRDKWSLSEASNQLGVDQKMMTSIFKTLGYVERHSDQCWIRGEYGKHLMHRQAWREEES